MHQMLPFFRKDFPSAKDDLIQALEQALRRFVPKSGQIVDLRARVFPYVDEIAINLDGVKFDAAPPPFASAEGETKQAFETALVTIRGRQISVRGVPLDLRMELRDVIFHKGADANGDVVLVVHEARDGVLVLSASQLGLEEAIARIGGARARLYGIDLEQVRLAMRARGHRSLAADIQIQAKKFFARAKINIYAQLDIDGDFVAKISQLKCKGDGKLGSFACGTLQPFFTRITEKFLPLKSIALGQIQLRDIHVVVADTVELTIDFGSA